MQKNVFISAHPLVADKLARLRDRRTPMTEFRRLMGEIGMLLGYEALADAEVRPSKVRTPLGPCRVKILSRDVVFVAVLRAGLGMLDDLVKLHPEAKMGHIGIYRDEASLKPVQYYSRLPRDLSRSFVVIVDPMLATGGSAVKAVEILKARGARKLSFMGLIGAAAGVKRLSSAYPDLPIHIGAVDRELNADGYIVPGLGDAGDRMCGTD